MLSITRRISPYNHSSGNDIEYIVLHDTGNYRDTAAGNANYFNEGDRQASAHYFVDENSIWQVVEENEASWHCGDGGGRYGIGNHNSIGIEMCNSGGYIAEATIQNTVELVRHLMSKYGISDNKVVRHYDASRKVCPNNMSANNWTLWNEFKNRLAKGDVKKVKNLIIYGEGADKRAAEYLGDYLKAPICSKDNLTTDTINAVETLYMVGGTWKPTDKAILISGGDRFSTIKAVISYIG